MHDQFSLQAIGQVRSPYKEKFGIPRQPGLAQSVSTEIVLHPDYSQPDIVRGLEACTHIWLVFIFSECVGKGWNPTVRPPRLGGNKRMGVFATRSPFRPNPIGLSPVSLIAIEQQGSETVLKVSGADLLDGTPILDIKPYLPYSDCIPSAEFGLAQEIERLQQEIVFSELSQQQCQQQAERLLQPLQQQVQELLSCDPRPAYKKNDADKVYGVRLYDLNIRFRISDEFIFVDEISEQDSSSG